MEPLCTWSRRLPRIEDSPGMVPPTRHAVGQEHRHKHLLSTELAFALFWAEPAVVPSWAKLAIVLALAADAVDLSLAKLAVALSPSVVGNGCLRAHDLKGQHRMEYV